MSQYVRNLRPRQASSIPNVIFALLIVNGLVFALQQQPSWGFALRNWFALWPAGVPGSLFAPWQLLTYGFMHADIVHIAFNMFMLWMWGRELELLMGARRFLTYYLVCIVGAGIVQLLVASFTGSYGITVGASGGVFGLLLAFGMAFPNRMIMLLFPPVPMRAKYMVIVFGLLELYLGVSGTTPGIANFAHLGGMLFGFGLLRYWSKRR